MNPAATPNPQPTLDQDQLLVESLLARTSRTFALTIPLLPPNLRRQVGVAYLLFRVADSIEDGVQVDRLHKRRLFDAFSKALSDESECAKFVDMCREQPPHPDVDCAELMQSMPRILNVACRDAEPCERIFERVRESTAGMQRFTTAGGSQGNVRLKSLVELRQYCYSVAGIVGELLTELFLIDNPKLDSIRNPLFLKAPAFGEGLQLVNILKDSSDDLKEGRLFVPTGIPREMLFELAREDLVIAQQYIDLLRENHAVAGVIQFNQLPVSLAVETLERVETDGPGSKVPRERVAEIVQEILQHKG